MLLKPILLSLAALSAAFTTTIKAEQDLPEIIVTANRTANTVDETLAPVSIITKEDIQRLQATSVTDILATVPGIDISRNGGLGSNQSIYLRGTNSNQVLVLINGIPTGSATVGTTPFQFLPVSQIERIEVVRGPHSSLYGSSAMGGVIQIFTHKEIEGQQLITSVGYGSDNTREFNSSYSNGNKNSHYQLGFGYLESDGYNFLGDTAPDNDDDGFDNYSLSLVGSHHFNDQFAINGTFLHSEGKSQFDGYSYAGTHSDYEQQIISVSADYDINDRWRTQIQVGQSIDDMKNHLMPGFDSRFKTKKEMFSWKNELLFRDSDLLTLGIDHLDESVNSSTDYQEDSRWNKALFVQYQYYGDVFDIKASWRYDDNEAFGSYQTGNITFGFDLDEYVRVTTSYGTAFKAPTFNSLYWPVESFPAFFYTYQGNPDLNPEESESFEFGLNGHFNTVKWSAHYYSTTITDLISPKGQLNPVTFFWEESPQNIGKAHIDGIELTLQTKWLNWLIQGSYSHVNPKDHDTGNILPGRSENQFHLDLDKSVGSFTYGASIIAASERYTSSNKRIAGYGIMNLRGSWQLNRHWTVKAKIDNLFDKQYATALSYTGLPFYAQDRYAFVSMHYEM